MNIIWVTLWRTITVVYYHFINNLLCNKNEKKIAFTIPKLNTKQMYKSYWQKMKSKQNHIFIFIFKNECWRVLIWILNFDFFWNTMYMHVILYFKYINIFHIFLIKCLQVLRHFFFYFIVKQIDQLRLLGTLIPLCIHRSCLSGLDTYLETIYLLIRHSRNSFFFKLKYAL